MTISGRKFGNCGSGAPPSTWWYRPSPSWKGSWDSYVKYPEDDDIDHLIIGFAQDNGTDTWRSEDLQFWTNTWSYRDFDHGVTLPLMMKNGHEIGQKMAHALWEQAAE